MLSFVVTKVTSDFVSRIWFYLFACLGLLSFLWALKIQGAALLRAYWYKKTLKNMGVFLWLLARARIGVEIIYSLSVFVGHGVNRLKLRCKRVSLFW